VLDSPCLDQTLDDSDINRLKDHSKVKDLTLGPPISFDCHISFDWPYFGPFPSPFRDDVFHFNHSDHSQWSIHSYSHIFVRPLTCASDVTCTHFSSVCVESFDKLKKALSCIPGMRFIWAMLPICNYIHFYEDGARFFDKLL